MRRQTELGDGMSCVERAIVRDGALVVSAVATRHGHVVRACSPMAATVSEDTGMSCALGRVNWLRNMDSGMDVRTTVTIGLHAASHVPVSS